MSEYIRFFEQFKNSKAIIIENVPKSSGMSLYGAVLAWNMSHSDKRMQAIFDKPPQMIGCWDFKPPIWSDDFIDT